MDGIKGHLHERSLIYVPEMYNCSTDKDCPSNLVCYSCKLSWVDHCNNYSSQCLCSSNYGHTRPVLSNTEDVGHEIGPDLVICKDFGNGYILLILMCLGSLVSLMKMIRITYDFIRVYRKSKLKFNISYLSHICTLLAFTFIFLWQQFDSSVIYNPGLLVNYVKSTERKQSIYYLPFQVSILCSFLFFSPASMGLSVSWIWVVQKAKYFKTVRKQQVSQRRTGLSKDTSHIVLKSGLSDSARKSLKRYMIAAVTYLCLQTLLLTSFGILGKWEMVMILSIPFNFVTILSYIIGGRLLSNMLKVTERARRESSQAQNESRSNRQLSGRIPVRQSDEFGASSSPIRTPRGLIRVLHTSASSFDMKSSDSDGATKSSTTPRADSSDEAQRSPIKVSDLKFDLANDATDVVTANSLNVASSANIIASTKTENKTGSQSPIRHAFDRLTADQGVKSSPRRRTPMISMLSKFDEEDSSFVVSKSEDLASWISFVTKGVTIGLVWTIVVLAITFTLVLSNYREFSPPSLVSPFPVLLRLIPFGLLFALSCIESFYHHCIILPAIQPGNTSENTVGSPRSHNNKENNNNNTGNINKEENQSQESSDEGEPRFRSRTKSREYGKNRLSEVQSTWRNESYASGAENGLLITSTPPNVKRKIYFASPNQQKDNVNSNIGTVLEDKSDIVRVGDSEAEEEEEEKVNENVDEAKNELQIV